MKNKWLFSSLVFRALDMRNVVGMIFQKSKNFNAIDFFCAIFREICSSNDYETMEFAP